MRVRLVKMPSPGDDTDAQYADVLAGSLFR